MSIAENYDAAVMQATELAKQLIAGLIETNITAIIENTVANEQLSKEQAASITRTISASKNIISDCLGGVGRGGEGDFGNEPIRPVSE